MFKDPVEIAELRATTHDLIQSNKWPLAFKRSVFTRTTSGGQVRDEPEDLDPQDVYFGAVTIDAAYTLFREGNKVQADYVIVGYWPDHPNALDIQEKDTFEAEGRKFEVIEIHPDHQYETRAWVVDRTSNGGN